MDIPSTNHKFKKGDIVRYRYNPPNAGYYVVIDIREGSVYWLDNEDYLLLQAYDPTTGNTTALFDGPESEFELVDMKGANI